MGINGSSWPACFHSHGYNGFQVERSATVRLRVDGEGTFA